MPPNIANRSRGSRRRRRGYRGRNQNARAPARPEPVPAAAPSSSPQPVTIRYQGEPPYTDEERAWLQRTSGGEFAFLRQYGFKTYDPVEQEHGRRLARSFIADEAADQLSALQGVGQHSDESSSDSDQRAPPSDPPLESSRIGNKRKKTVETHVLPSGEAYNIDWIFSTTSNVHAAKHREWFKTYIPFEATSPENLKIVGAGTVELPVVTNKGCAIITLRNVVHAPSAICNIVGMDLMEVFGGQLGGGSGKVYLDEKMETWAYIDASVLFRLRLVHQSDTQTSLDPDAFYAVRASLPAEERSRMTERIMEEEIRKLKSAG
ncbi:hypothetical protein H072_6672 [Dactylellina haptotyla CBS 200.50]|uniref:Retrovirus-related Pol polyprotein from transposon TNT 1-94-like beta-barrel domain-containing protein n=1 Tax=Dactylellina haptotyla (strain CBS 200.50) TaxID=1284197 RepID=S8A913_DACHA|nr:hypothetical protein H072_6672 [Dactylellina haptotyla CBS 200.50]